MEKTKTHSKLLHANTRERLQWQVIFFKEKKRLDKIVEYFCFAGKILLNFIFTFVPFISISLPQTAIAIIWPLTFVNLPIQFIEIDDSSVVIIVIKFSVRIELVFRSPCVFSLSSSAFSIYQ